MLNIYTDIIFLDKMYEEIIILICIIKYVLIRRYVIYFAIFLHILLHLYFYSIFLHIDIKKKNCFMGTFNEFDKIIAILYFIYCIYFIGRDDVRMARKKAIKTIQDTINILENKVPQPQEEPMAVEKSTDNSEEGVSVENETSVTEKVENNN